MGFMLKILVYLCLSAGVWGVQQIQWLPCHFADEFVFKNDKGNTDIKVIHRNAILQFGQKGDTPVNPNIVTFLVTRGRLDLLQYVEGAEVEQLECVVRRYSTEGNYVRWPVLGAREYNHWFSCTLRHTRGLFNVTSFLRHPSDQPPPGRHDYHKWPIITDGEILTTTVALVIKTQTPSMKVGLMSQKNLHCQFDVDHEGAEVTVEWYWHRHGQRTKLFSYTRSTEQIQGSGVRPEALAAGDASYTLLNSKISSEGNYICSVSVNPLVATVSVNLRIQEPPRVSLNVGPTLSMRDGTEQKVVCEASNYYPLDVEMVWHEMDLAVSGQSDGTPMLKLLENVLLTSHKHNPDGTYSRSAFFYLKASLRSSGRQFICSVSHQSLKVPIKKSFTLNVTDLNILLMYLWVGFIVISLLYVMRSCLRSGWRNLVRLIR